MMSTSHAETRMWFKATPIGCYPDTPGAWSGPWHALWALVAYVVLVVGVAAPAHADQQIFDELNGPVWATAVGADGTTYVGGQFTAYGPRTGGGAVLAATGTGALNRQFPAVMGEVWTAVPDGVGGWYIGGSFSQVAGVNRNHLAHITGTGALDMNWNPGVNGGVTALAVSGSTIYAGGQFSGAGGGDGSQETRNYLAAFDGSGAVLPWNPGASSYVLTLAVSGSTVYAGGYFTGVGGGDGSQATRNYLAAFDASGAVLPWNPGANNFVNSLAVAGTTVYAGGAFTFAGNGGTGNRSRNYLAAFSTSTGALSTWNPGANSQVNTLAISGGTVYAGGYFSAAGGGAGLETRLYLAAFDSSGEGDLTAWNPGTNNVVFELAASGGTVYAGGYFSTAGGGDGSQVTRNNLAAFDASGAVLPWNPNPASANVFALTASGSSVYVGGNFSSVGGTTTPRNYLAAFDASGNLSAWNPGANNSVNTLAVSGSTVYAGGQFSQAGGGEGNQEQRLFLAAFDLNGGLTSWNPGANSYVYSLAASGSTVYAGGTFSVVGGGDGSQTARNYLAAFDASGAVLPWNPGANNFVNSLAVAGTTVYAGGAFTFAGNGGTGNRSRNYLAAFSTSTGALSTWNPGANSQVNTLAISGGTVYAGGYFSAAGGGAGLETRYYLAAFDASGEGDITTWDPGANGVVSTLAVSGSTVYAGGWFTMAGGSAGTGSTGDTPRNYLAAFDTNGGHVTSWNPNANGQVIAMAVSGSTVYAGGSFTQIGGTTNGATSPYLAQLLISGLPSAPTNVGVVRGNASGTVSWTAPIDDGGSTITAYVLEKAPGPNYDTWTPATTSGACTASPCTVTGLSNGTRYQVRVRAVNANGTGATSLASQWFQPQAPTANPAVPTGLSATPGNTTLSVTWNAVTDFGAGATTITQYMAYVFTGSTLLKTCRVTGAPAPTACQVTGLANGSSYTIKVRAWNNTGKFSDLSPAVGPYTPTP